jgi:hypothetical protein
VQFFLCVQSEVGVVVEVIVVRSGTFIDVHDFL